MSYDIELRLPEGTPLTSEAERTRNAKAVAALKRLNPNLELFESEDVLELTDVAGNTGIQISLFRDSGGLSVPYWHDGNASEVLDQISRYLQVLTEEAGYLAFDPQTDRQVTAASAYSLDPTAYSSGVAALNQVTKKPWWRFW